MRGEARVDDDAVRAERLHLERVVREQPDRADAQVLEHGRRRRVVARVVGQAEQAVGVDRVVPVGLELVGADLVAEPDPAPLLPEVEQHALPTAGDLGLRGLELLLAVALERAERLARQALGVHANDDPTAAANLAHDERHVVGREPELGVLRVGLAFPAEDVHLKDAVPRGHRRMSCNLELRPDRH